MPTLAERRAQADAKRQAEQLYRKWYKLALWCGPHGLRRQQLARQPLCETCLKAKPPRITPATVVHHKVDHQGDWQLFIAPANHESACKPCHDGELQRERFAPRRGERGSRHPRGV